MNKFPRPFGGITHSITLPTTLDASFALNFILNEQNDGHFHNFAVEVDDPHGITFYGSELLMNCLERWYAGRVAQGSDPTQRKALSEDPQAQR